MCWPPGALGAGAAVDRGCRRSGAARRRRGRLLRCRGLVGRGRPWRSGRFHRSSLVRGGRRASTTSSRAAASRGSAPDAASIARRLPGDQPPEPPGGPSAQRLLPAGGTSRPAVLDSTHARSHRPRRIRRVHRRHGGDRPRPAGRDRAGPAARRHPAHRVLARRRGDLPGLARAGAGPLLGARRRGRGGGAADAARRPRRGMRPGDRRGRPGLPVRREAGPPARRARRDAGRRRPAGRPRARRHPRRVLSGCDGPRRPAAPPPRPPLRALPDRLARRARLRGGRRRAAALRRVSRAARRADRPRPAAPGGGPGDRRGDRGHRARRHLAGPRPRTGDGLAGPFPHAASRRRDASASPADPEGPPDEGLSRP